MEDINKEASPATGQQSEVQKGEVRNLLVGVAGKAFDNALEANTDDTTSLRRARDWLAKPAPSSKEEIEKDITSSRPEESDSALIKVAKGLRVIWLSTLKPLS